jgi:hypothetical protein
MKGVGLQEGRPDVPESKQKWRSSFSHPSEKRMDVKKNDLRQPGRKNLMLKERRIADGGFRITRRGRETRNREGF